MNPLKVLKALNDPVKKAEIGRLVVTQIKLQKASEATLECIREGLKGYDKVGSVRVRPGRDGLLPPTVTAEIDGEERIITPVQPEKADFDYPELCRDFNEELKADPDTADRFSEMITELLERSGFHYEAAERTNR